MNGIDKITEKILSDAREYEASAKKETDERVKQIETQARNDAQSESDTILQKASTDADNIIKRAQSSAELIRRNAILKAKSEIIDECFEKALLKVSELPKEEYAALLEKWLYDAVNEQIKSEKLHESYADDEPFEPVNEYYAVFNANDRETVAKTAVDNVNKRTDLSGKRVFIGGMNASIAGGFILKCADIELNCSLEALISRARQELEPKICEVLFG